MCVLSEKYKNEVATYVKEWSSKALLGTVSLPVKDLTTPLEDIRSRHLDTEHI